MNSWKRHITQTKKMLRKGSTFGRIDINYLVRPPSRLTIKIIFQVVDREQGEGGFV
jgi:hypothetical protein